jgi:hypothetical protein
MGSRWSGRSNSRPRKPHHFLAESTLDGVCRPQQHVTSASCWVPRWKIGAAIGSNLFSGFGPAPLVVGRSADRKRLVAVYLDQVSRTWKFIQSPRLNPDHLSPLRPPGNDPGEGVQRDQWLLRKEIEIGDSIAIVQSPRVLTGSRLFDRDEFTVDNYHLCEMIIVVGEDGHVYATALMKKISDGSVVFFGSNGEDNAKNVADRNDFHAIPVADFPKWMNLYWPGRIDNRYWRNLIDGGGFGDPGALSAAWNSSALFGAVLHARSQAPNNGLYDAWSATTVATYSNRMAQYYSFPILPKTTDDNNEIVNSWNLMTSRPPPHPEQFQKPMDNDWPLGASFIGYQTTNLAVWGPGGGTPAIGMFGLAAIPAVDDAGKTVWEVRAVQMTQGGTPVAGKIVPYYSWRVFPDF